MIYVNSIALQQNHFPDGTLNLKIPPITYSEDKPVMLTWNYENDAELFTLICARRHFRDRPVSLFMDYIPHARMDRVKNDEDVFTLKYFCEVINSLNFKRVYVLDPHSSVSTALLDRVVIAGAGPHIQHVMGDIIWGIGDEKEFAVFYPDEGSMKRYSTDAPCQYAFGVKTRDWETGKILGLKVINEENIKGKTILIIDDICSRGGTFYHSAKALKEYTDKDIYLYITHCEKTILEGDLIKSGLVKKIYTANALFEIPEEYKDIIIEL